MLFGKLFFQQLLQFFLAGQNRFVLAGEDLGVVLRQGHFDNGVVFVLAENDADGGVFFRQFDLAVVVVDVHLHLSNVLVLQFADFQVKEDEAAQKPVVKHQVYDEMLLVKRELVRQCLTFLLRFPADTERYGKTACRCRVVVRCITQAL